MLTSTTSSTSTRRTGRLSATAKLTIVGAAVASSLALGATSAAATNEFPTNPTLSPTYECQGGEYLYHLGLYNSGGIGATTFTVTVTGAVTPRTPVSLLGQHDYLVDGGKVQGLDYKVAEGQTASFHVVDTDGPTAIDFLAEPRADCIADPETSVKVVCDDATGAATIQYDWVNSSYTTAHFSLQQNGATFQEGDYQASGHVETTSIPVAEGSQAVASITVDGDEASAIDQLVDCVPDVTTTTVTPDTTPATTPATIPDTTPETTPETTTTVVAVLLPDSGQPSTSVVRPAPLLEDIMLPETGSKNSTTSVAGITLLGLGLVLVRLARRAR